MKRLITLLVTFLLSVSVFAQNTAPINNINMETTYYLLFTFLCFFNMSMTILFGYISSKMAGERNRDKVIGAILGCTFGLWAIIGYAIAGEKKIKEDL